AKKRADRGEKFQVAAAHCLPRDHQFACEARNVRDIIEHQHVAVGAHAVVMESQCHASVLAIIDLNFVALENKAIFFTREIFAPETFFSAYNEMSVVVFAFCPRKRCRTVEFDSFPAKRDLSRFENDPENHVTERSGKRGANTGCYPRICLHQSWNKHAASHAGDCSADCYAVRNDEMLKIDESSDDQERNKNPVGNRHLPGEPLTDRNEKKCGNEFHREIAERNFCAAICTPAAKHKPTDQGKIVMPWNRLFALRTKRATRPIDGEINRPAINANVQKRADRRAEHESKYADEKILNRM